MAGTSRRGCARAGLAVRRRELVLALAGVPLAVPVRLFAQSKRSFHRVGVLSPRSRPPSLDADYYGAFPRRMRELGYVEGRNLIIEWRFADGHYDRLPAMAAELVKQPVDVILALGPPGAIAAQKATTTTPIVIVTSGDPIAAGLVKSLAQPGGNITGLFNLAGDLVAKHLELLLAIAPKLTRVALLVNPTNPAHPSMEANVSAASRKASIAIVAVKAQTPQEITRAFSSMAAERAGALIIALDPLFIQQVPEIARQAAQHRLPSIFANREYAEAGGLISYGWNQADIYRRVASYVDRILKGASPATLPIEQPTKLDLVVNAKTARALNLAIPPSLLATAEVIE